MRIGRAWFWPAVVILCAPVLVTAEDRFYGTPAYGAFGERRMGETLRPKQGRFAGGLARGEAGDFIGIQPTYPGRTFLNGRRFYGGVKDQAQLRLGEPYQPTTAAAMPAARPAVPPGPTEFEPAAPIESPKPDAWLRSPPAATDRSRAGRSTASSESPSGEAEAAPQAAPVAVRRDLPLRRAVAEPASFASPEADRKLAKLLSTDPRIRRQTQIQVTTQDGVTTLRGRVATADDRAIAEAVARMEPGVWTVRNELSVSQASPLRGEGGRE